MSEPNYPPELQDVSSKGIMRITKVSSIMIPKLLALVFPEMSSFLNIFRFILNHQIQQLQKFLIFLPFHRLHPRHHLLLKFCRSTPIVQANCPHLRWSPITHLCQNLLLIQVYPIHLQLSYTALRGFLYLLIVLVFLVACLPCLLFLLHLHIHRLRKTCVGRLLWLMRLLLWKLIKLRSLFPNLSLAQSLVANGFHGKS